MNLRCTSKLLKLLGVRPEMEPPEEHHNWYGNLLWIDRRKSLLLTHEDTLFSIFVPDIRKADLTPLGQFMAEHISVALRQERLPPRTFGELSNPQVTVAKTRSRSVLGSMNDMAYNCFHWVESLGGLANMQVEKLNHDLRTTPMGALNYAYPLDKVKELAWQPSAQKAHGTEGV